MSDSQSDLKADMTGADKPKTKVCNQWVASGSCTYADRCHFSHDPKQKGSMIRTTENNVEVEERNDGMVVKDTDLIFSGMVQLSQELPESLSDLRGTMAQAFGIC